MQLIIYTHTDYLDIFQITIEHLSKIKTQHSIIILTNQYNQLYDNLHNKELVLYDDKLTYPSRIASCLNKLINYPENYNFTQNEYFLFCHDNDVIIKYDENILDKIAITMKENNISKVDLCILTNISLGENYFSTNTIEIDKLNVHIIKNPEFFAFSVGPSIWHFRNYLDILEKYKDKNYRNIEGEEVQENMKQNYLVYNAGKNDIFETYGGRTFNNYFGWLHITTNGKFLFDHNSKYINYIKELYTKYNIKR